MSLSDDVIIIKVNDRVSYKTVLPSKIITALNDLKKKCFCKHCTSDMVTCQGAKIACCPDCEHRIYLFDLKEIFGEKFTAKTDSEVKYDN